jgi:hypothetical protein
MIALASFLPQQEILVVGSSRRTTHVPHNSLGMACAVAVVANIAVMMAKYNILLIQAPP